MCHDSLLAFVKPELVALAPGLGLSLRAALTVLSLLFPRGVLLLLAAPETRGRELPA
jgi:hypothetical protein